MDPTVVAIGGGSLVEDRKAQQIETYILGLTGKADPKVCFIGTASGDAAANVVRFYTVFSSDRCRPSHLMLVNRQEPDLSSFLLNQDVIYVGGGNTAAMLAIWRQQGVDAILEEAWRRGIVLCGSSAGANCWFEACSTDSWGLPLQPLNDGLRFLSGSFCPHYDVESTRRATYHQAVGDGSLPAGYAADNCVALCYTDTELTEIVGSTPTARAYRVEKDRQGVIETELVPRFLGG